MNVIGGTTDVTTFFVLRTAADGTATTGATMTDIDLQYTRTGTAPTAKVDATALAATDSAHADNKAIEIDGTDQPGLYRVDWPDAAFAAGVRQVVLTVKLASSFTEHLAVDIDPPVGAAASVTGAVGSVTGAVGSVTGAVGSVAGNVGGNVGGSVAGSVGSVTGAVGSVTAGVTLANDAISSAQYDETTAFPLKAVDAGVTQIARVGADGDSLEDLSDEIAAAKAVLDTAAADVANIDGDAMRGTDSANTTVPDAAGTAAGLHATTDAAIAGLNDLSAADVNAQVDAALDTAIPGSPTADSINERIKNLSDAGGASAESIADAVCDEALSGHTTGGTVGAALTSASSVVSDLMSHTGITAGGAASYETMLKAFYALGRGKITKVGNVYTYYDDDDTTELFTLTVSASGRATS